MLLVGVYLLNNMDKWQAGDKVEKPTQSGEVTAEAGDMVLVKTSDGPIVCSQEELESRGWRKTGKKEES